MSVENVKLDRGRELHLHLPHIGEGGYSRVYRCTVTTKAGHDSHIFACKRIKLFQDTDRCLLEVAIMSSISHPNLAKAEFSGVTRNNELFLVQELAVMDLRKMTQEKKITPTSRITTDLMEKFRNWAHDVTLGIQCLHVQEIIHGDIKAENALMFRDGHVALSDFSLSLKKWTYENMPGNAIEDGRRRTIISTVTHRAPEVFAVSNGSSPWRQTAPAWDESSDMWSLGCTLYEMTRGVNLFDASRDEDVWSSIIAWASSDNPAINPWGKQTFQAYAAGPRTAAPPPKITLLSTRCTSILAEQIDDLISACLVIRLDVLPRARRSCTPSSAACSSPNAGSTGRQFIRSKAILRTKSVSL
jgi:serine/threonine protein kinase